MTAKLPSFSSKMSGQLCPVALPRSRGEAPMRRTIFKSVPSLVRGRVATDARDACGTGAAQKKQFATGLTPANCG
ncbi:hypothetical protein GCM10018782_04210 [Streptomyces griseoaurantiacus]|nr:hypothetical protein GCM10018782_04210 [Streptomyces griseoaurantiacus]